MIHDIRRGGGSPFSPSSIPGAGVFLFLIHSLRVLRVRDSPSARSRLATLTTPRGRARRGSPRSACTADPCGSRSASARRCPYFPTSVPPSASAPLAFSLASIPVPGRPEFASLPPLSRLFLPFVAAPGALESPSSVCSPPRSICPPRDPHRRFRFVLLERGEVRARLRRRQLPELFTFANRPDPRAVVRQRLAALVADLLVPEAAASRSRGTSAAAPGERAVREGPSERRLHSPTAAPARPESSSRADRELAGRARAVARPGVPRGVRVPACPPFASGLTPPPWPWPPLDIPKELIPEGLGGATPKSSSLKAPKSLLLPPWPSCSM